MAVREDAVPGWGLDYAPPRPVRTEQRFVAICCAVEAVSERVGVWRCPECGDRFSDRERKLAVLAVPVRASGEPLWVDVAREVRYAGRPVAKEALAVG